MIHQLEAGTDAHGQKHGVGLELLELAGLHVLGDDAVVLHFLKGGAVEDVELDAVVGHLLH